MEHKYLNKTRRIDSFTKAMHNINEKEKIKEAEARWKRKCFLIKGSESYTTLTFRESVKTPQLIFGGEGILSNLNLLAKSSSHHLMIPSFLLLPYFF